MRQETWQSGTLIFLPWALLCKSLRKNLLFVIILLIPLSLCDTLCHFVPLCVTLRHFVSLSVILCHFVSCFNLFSLFTLFVIILLIPFVLLCPFVSFCVTLCHVLIYFHFSLCLTSFYWFHLSFCVTLCHLVIIWQIWIRWCY